MCTCKEYHGDKTFNYSQYQVQLNILCRVYGFVWPIDCSVKHHTFQSIKCNTEYSNTSGITVEEQSSLLLLLPTPDDELLG